MPIKAKEKVREAVKKIARHSRRYRHEDNVRNAIKDLLISLGWDTSNPDEVEPERRIIGSTTKQVDFSLQETDRYNNTGRPIVFIEAKARGKIDADRKRRKAQEQLFGYANKESPPLLVLTDGVKWIFYLYLTTGKPDEKIFWEGEISKGKNDECVKAFRAYLSHRAVINGNAEKKADMALKKKRALTDKKNKERTLHFLQQSWHSLLEEKPAPLLRLLRKKAKEKFPQHNILDDVIKEFLSKQAKKSLKGKYARQPEHAILVRQSSKKSIKDSSVRRQRKNNLSSRSIPFRYNGYNYTAKNGRDMLMQTLELFQRSDSSFLKRLSAKSKIVNQRKRALFGESISDEVVERFSKSLSAGNKKWWVNVKVSKNRVKSVIAQACKLQNITYGRDFKILSE